MKISLEDIVNIIKTQERENNYIIRNREDTIHELQEDIKILCSEPANLLGLSELYLKTREKYILRMGGVPSAIKEV